MTLSISIWKLIILSLLHFSILLHHTVFAENAEALLMKDLMVNYFSKARPVVNSSDAVQVNISLTLSHIIQLDEKQERFTWVVWINERWYDPHLKWQPEKYGGLESVYIEQDKIWMPDIYLYNIVSESENMATKFLGQKDILSLIFHDGKVIVYLPLRIQTACQVDLLKFPFDTQTCPLIIGSWVYPENHLKYALGKDPVIHSKQGPWKVINFTSNMGPTFPYFGSFYPFVTFDLEMKRNPLFYVLNLIVPSYLMSGIMLLSLLLPVESGERMSVGLTIFMTYSVFSVIISNIVPDSASSPPIICILLIINMCLSLIINGWTVLVIRINHHASHGYPMPGWLRYLLNLKSTSGDSVQKPHPQGNKYESNLMNIDKNEKKDTKENAASPDWASKIQFVELKSAASAESDFSLTEWKKFSDFGDRFLALIYLVVTILGLISLFIMAY